MYESIRLLCSARNDVSVFSTFVLINTQIYAWQFQRTSSERTKVH